MGQYLFGDIKIYQRGRGNNLGGFKALNGKTPTLSSSSWQENNYLFGVITPDIINKTQNGQRINDGQKFYTLTTRARHGVLVEGYLRKLTPIECERLQGLEDNYTEGVSKTQRYKMVGNGFQRDTIEWIFSFYRKHVIEGVPFVTRETLGQLNLIP